MKEIIKQIIEYAVNAPSGDNSQPWRFVVRENKIYLYNLPERDLTLYNFKRRGDYVAHGALIENIVIAASRRGFNAEIDLFPEKDNQNLISRLTLKKAPMENSPLYEPIEKRATNRKPYKLDLLTENQKNELFKSEDEIGGGELILIEKRDDIESLAKEISLNERLMLENFQIHNFLFSIIRWTRKEEKEKPGMFVKTLELAPPQLFVFKNIFRRWSLLQFLNKIIKVSKLLPKESAKNYSRSSAIGIITIDGDSEENFVFSGRLFERVWLKAAKMDYYIQPITAIPYLAQRIYAGDSEKLSHTHAELIKEADKKIRKICGIPERKTIAMIFRMGRADPPSAHSFKMPPEIIFED